MSCNAWNHRPDCTCGWGGVFYGAGYREGADDSWHWQRSTSYTTPNAYCPKCNASVFFYRSPYGGSVYFDDLGPPWPKHQCMDLGRTNRPRPENRTTGSTSNQSVSVGGRESGWRPLICDEVHRHKGLSGVVVLSVQSGPGGVSTLYSVFDRILLDHRTPFVARRSGNGSIEISTLNTQVAVPYEVRLIAYESISDLLQRTRVTVAGGQTRQAPLPPVSLKPQDKIPKVPVAKTTKKPQPDRAQVQVTYKHRHQDRIKLTVKQPALNEQTTEPITRPLTETRQEHIPTSKPAVLSKKNRSLEATKPITNMALAFQKLAETNPEIKNLVIQRFPK